MTAEAVGITPAQWSEFRIVVAIVATMVVGTWHVRGRLGKIYGELQRLNGSVAQNTEYRKALQNDPPVTRVEIRGVKDGIDQLRRVNMAQLDDLNIRRHEKGLPPIEMSTTV